MNQQHANFDNDQRRAGIRRTAWVVGGIAIAMFVLFFVKQGIWHSWTSVSATAGSSNAR